MAMIKGNTMERLWWTWKSYRFPWRSRYFIGMDLEGNTYWEMKTRLNASRARRIVQYKDLKDLVDYKVSPQWHQWLRSTRFDPPTITEQELDIERLKVLKHNATLADLRWASKPSLLNAGPHPLPDSVLESNTKYSNDSGLQPREKQILGRGEVGADLGGKGVEKKLGAGEMAVGREDGIRGKESPWKDADRKGDGFKPGVWDPNAGLPKQRPGRV
ncbi:hypothetical protein RUND412_003758 [Rhizina undulata]